MGGSLGTLAAPSATSGPGGGSISFSATVNVNLPAGFAPGVDGERAGHQIGDAVAQAMSEKLAELTRRRARALGETLIS
jgi:hypothetical protein